MKKAYLALYNAAQTALWSIALFKCVEPHLAAKGLDLDLFSYATYASGKYWVELAQGLAAMEILHALVGIAGGSVPAAIMQWAGRSNVLFLALRMSVDARTSPCAGVLFITWALSEVIRYPWALLTTLKRCPHALLWLRYTAFMALYPIGFVCEAALIYMAIPAFRAANFLAVSMPNAFNWAFSYADLMQGLVCVYPFLSLFMYTYMLQQRAKKLGAGSSASPAQKKQK